MSEFFVKKFKKSNPCNHCRKSRLRVGKRVYSLCGNHLNIARDRWRTWAKTRRLAGLCVSCDKHSFNGWLRCNKHTLINRKRCRAWSATHKEHLHERYLMRIATYIERGFCICKAHNRLTGGFRRCSDCRARQAQHRINSDRRRDGYVV